MRAAEEFKVEKSSDLAGKKIRKMENKAYHYLCVVKKQKATLSKTCFISVNVIVAQPSLASSVNRREHRLLPPASLQQILSD